jgi:hypothetical protein
MLQSDRIRNKTMNQKIFALLGGLSASLLLSFTGVIQPINASVPSATKQIAQDSGAKPTKMQAAELLFQQALRKTQKQDFRGAIATLKQATTLFRQDEKLAQAYKSQALAEYLTWNLKNVEPPNWYGSGSCFGVPICQYITTHITPDFSQSHQGINKNDYGGVLMLLKPVRYRPSSTGGQTPVNAVLDVQLTPKLMSEEYVAIGSCQLNGKPDSEIVALIKVTPSDQQQDLFTKIRQAWRINLKAEKIEPIPTKGLTCVNPCPGGC